MTINELAKIAGVSISTVSKVMNNKDSSISQATRERILELAKEYHYTVPSASSQKAARSLTIGVILSSSQKISLTLFGMIESAQKKGYTLMIRESQNDTELERKNLSALLYYNVDGILWEPINSSSISNIEELIPHNIPYIIFNADSSDAVNIDFKSMGYTACRELIQRGHRYIACLLYEGIRTDKLIEGYKQCLFDNSLSFSNALIYTSISDTLLRKISDHSISGVICSHFKAASELYGEVYSRHYSMPYDVSLISLKDIGRNNITFPHVSTINIPHYEYGKFLCDNIISAIEDPLFSIPTGNYKQKIHLESTDTVGLPFNSQKKSVVVVGSVNIDNYLNVEALPYSGKTVKSIISSSYAGGKALNTAVGVSKLGHSVSLLCKTGNDSESDIIFSTINNYNINPVAVKRSQNEKTGQAYIFVQPDGESMITIMSGANNSLSASDIVHNINLFDNAAFCLMNTEIPIDVLIKAAYISKQHNICTILKPATCSVLPDELLKNIDIIVPNQSELSEICSHGKNIEEKASHLISSGVNKVIVTLGDKGCLLMEKHTHRYYPAQDFDAIDASGACDAFISALASYLLYGYDLDSAIRIAHYAAGFSVTRQGVIPSLIDKNSLESYIKQREPDLIN